MSLSTFSVFYYGHEVTTLNNLIDFAEGAGPPLIAEVTIGKYTITDFAIAVQDALNTSGLLTYTLSVDRTTRFITISATGTFSLYTTSGASLGTSAFTLLGFSGANRTGAATYTGNFASGSAYFPQFILQDHVPQENFKKTVQASVNESASGDVEVVRFGSVRFTRFNIMFITNKIMDGRVMKNNPTGVTDANSFMNYITNVTPIEFMPNVADRNTFQVLQIESTPDSKDGIDYRLKELYDKGLPGIYETGTLQFRVLD